MSTSSHSTSPRIDAPGFEALVRRHGPELRVYCLRFTGGREAPADDILQAAFQIAWTKRESFHGGNARAWLYAITRQQALYRVRVETRYALIGPSILDRLAESAIEGAEEPAPDPAEIDAMRACFGELDAVDATILQAAYGLLPGPEPDEPLELTYAEIGELLRLERGEAYQPDRVRMRLKRALTRMLRCIRARAGR